MEISTRGAFRAQLTKLAKAANEALQSESFKISDNCEFEKIEDDLCILIDRLNAVHASLRSADQRIISQQLIKPEDVEMEGQKIADYEDTAVTTLAQLNQRLRKVQSKPRPMMNTEQQRNIISPQKGNTKLPKLQLKRFNGEMKEWLPFWDQYNIAVHQNEQLTDADKFHYLEGALVGAARRVVEGFTATSSCYEAAVALLREQYGDTEKLVDNHMQKLIALRPVSARTDVVGLRHLYNTITTSIRSLTALQVPTQQYDVMLKTVLLRCMPVELRVDYHRMSEKENDITELSDLENTDENNEDKKSQTTHTSLQAIKNQHVKSIMCFLKSEVEALEKSKVSPLHTHTRTNESLTTATSLLKITNNVCVFCNSKEHDNKDCDSRLSLQQKRDILLKSNRCFRCTKVGHPSKKCRSGNFLKCSKCGGKHLTTMCDPSFNKVTTAAMQVQSEESHADESDGSINLCAHTSNSLNYEHIFLKTARCLIGGSTKNDTIIRIVIDGGSQKSYICESLVEKLNVIRSETIKMSVIPFGAIETSPVNTYKKVKIVLMNQFNNKSVLVEAIVVPRICVDVLAIPDPSCSAFKHLKLADRIVSKDVTIVEGLSMLIGADFYWTIVSGKQRTISNSLRAVDTIFGWTLQGLHSPADTIASNQNNFATMIANVVEVTDHELSALWSLESIGIRGEDSEKQHLTQEMTQKYIKKSGSRYEAALPWKNPDLVYESNKSQAVSRLKSLTKRLSRDPAKLNEYDAAVRQLLSDGIAELVAHTSNEAPKRICYLPHRPVYKEDSATTKLRIVFDASSCTEDIPSLNDQLYTGTNLLPDVLKILLNFRLGRFGIVADIEKAFLQINLSQHDRDSHRFLWYASSRAIDQQSLIELRMTRVTFGVSCSPFILSATIRCHLEKQRLSFPETCKILEHSFYMDDLIVSVNSEAECSRIYEESLEIMGAASMNLRKWHSNCAQFRNKITSKQLPLTQKVLGLTWSVFSDELAVPMQSVQSFLESNLANGSKRNILQSIARVYDPLGIVCPTIVKLKILFQAAWKRKLSWDEALPADLLMDWNECVKNILQLKDMSIPRTVLRSSSFTDIQCHIFADASLKAYGAVCYIRAVDLEGSITVSFLCAKCRIAPLRQDGSDELTLPKLELTAALIAARMCLYLKEVIKVSINNYFLWTDSRITLNWIYGQAQRWKPFIQSRVVEIRRHTSVLDWEHCSGKENPADLITRGIPGDKLQNSSLWAYGPKWLYDFKPKENHAALDVEVKTILLLEVDRSPKRCRVPIFDFEKFGSWLRLLRVTSWVLRYIHLFSTKQTIAEESLTKAELEKSELYWIRYVQLFSFTNELNCLQKKLPLPASSKLIELSPFLDNEGLMRLGGRLQLLDESFDLKHPIILPSNHFITGLIVEYLHNLTIHAGVGTVLAKIRERFWIIKGRQLVKKKIKNCIVCKKLFGQPASQPFAPLPLKRITLTRPFDVVGIDFAGPLYYVTTKGSAMQKAYFLIFTCASVRAVHLELTTGLSTEACIMALRRFMSRRGVPSAIMSDNAKTFRRAALEMSEVKGLFAEEEIQSFLSQKRIQWSFIVERAPWWGGFWERLIRTVKNTLKVTIGKAKLTFEQLRTVLTEAEAIANDRPLTYVSSDPLDLAPLTPAKFLLGFSSSVSSFQADVSGETSLKDLWKHRMKFTARLSKRWQIEYLQVLRSFHHAYGKTSNQLNEGDIVLLFDQATPRIHWKMVIINKVFIGRDGKVRSCEIRRADGQVLRRPVQLLYPLELSSIGPPEDVEN